MAPAFLVLLALAWSSADIQARAAPAVFPDIYSFDAITLGKHTVEMLVTEYKFKL